MSDNNDFPEYDVSLLELYEYLLEEGDTRHNFRLNVAASLFIVGLGVSLGFLTLAFRVLPDEAEEKLEKIINDS